MDEQRDDLYAHYRELKGWTGEAVSYDAAPFAYFLKASGKTGKLRILEYGFGNGEFLDWARNQGHTAAGIEIQPESVEAARAKGLTAFLGTADVPLDGETDLLVAIDVLEHLDPPAMAELVRVANGCLKPDGVIVARFPNGDSPFLGRHQHGDYTHLKPISAASLRQILLPHGYAVVRAMNPRPLPADFLGKINERL